MYLLIMSASVGAFTINEDHDLKCPILLGRGPPFVQHISKLLTKFRRTPEAQFQMRLLFDDFYRRCHE